MSRNPAMFPQPPKAVRRLSQTYSAKHYRVTKVRQPRYSPIKVKNLPTCDECFANQFENEGAAPRAQAKARRTMPGGPTLNLCSIHANLWRERDEQDMPKK